MNTDQTSKTGGHITDAELQFLEHRKFSRQEIADVFRVPKGIVGYTEDFRRGHRRARKGGKA